MSDVASISEGKGMQNLYKQFKKKYISTNLKKCFFLKEVVSENVGIDFRF